MWKWFGLLIAIVAGAQAQTPVTLRQVLELEQQAEFTKALAVGSELLSQTTDPATVEEVRSVLGRLREEKRTAVGLAFAIDSLVTQPDVAAGELKKEPAVAALLLRRVVRTRDGPVTITAANLLAELKDEVAPAQVPEILALAGKINGTQLQPIIAAVGRKATDTNTLVAVYQQAKAGGHYAVAFLGMVRRHQYHDDTAAFDAAVGEAGAAAGLSDFMLKLAAQREPRWADFFMDNADYYPAAAARYEKTVVVTGWGYPNQIADFQVTPSGHVVGTVTGDDPFFYSADNLNIDLSVFKTIKVTLHNRSSAPNARFLFITNDSTGYGEDKTVFFAIKPNDSGFTKYVFDATTCANWKGILRQLRFDIVEGATTGQFEVVSVFLSDWSPRK